MKALIKILGHSLALFIFWFLSTIITSLFIKVEFDDEGNQYTLLLIWLSGLLITIILHFYLTNISLTRFKRFLNTSILIFGIQYFLSQIETLFFIDPEIMSRKMILFVVVSGLITSLLFGLLVSWSYKAESKPIQLEWIPRPGLFYRIALLALIAYPMIYFTFGYYVAWQSADVRMYYSGSTELNTYWSMIMANVFESKLYLFQVLRSFMWMGFGWLMMVGFHGTRLNAMLILGGLYAILMNSQHLIPNEIMPDPVRLMHAIETASSNFLWGVLVIYALVRSQ